MEDYPLPIQDGSRLVRRNFGRERLPGLFKNIIVCSRRNFGCLARAGYAIEATVKCCMWRRFYSIRTRRRVTEEILNTMVVRRGLSQMIRTMSGITTIHSLRGARRERITEEKRQIDRKMTDLTQCAVSSFQTYNSHCAKQFEEETCPAETEAEEMDKNDDFMEGHVGAEGPYIASQIPDLPNPAQTSNVDLDEDSWSDDGDSHIEENLGENPDIDEGIQSPVENDVQNEAVENEEDSDDESGMDWNRGEDAPITPEEAYLRDAARTPLFRDSRLSLLSTVILLLNCLRMHGASSVLVDELFTLLSKTILPKINSLPILEYEASKMLKKLNLKYEMIDVCPNECILFRGPLYKNLDTYPKCGASRGKRCGKSMVARRVLRFFPLIPRLVRMFRNAILVAAMSYAALHQSLDRKMPSVVDLEIWRFIDATYPSFAADPRNIRLALATDGINPFSDKRSTYSIWPVLFFNYNVVPWLTLKKFFVMLSVIMPEKNSERGEHWDMYMEPVLEELRFCGVQVFPSEMLRDSYRTPFIICER